MAFLCAFIVAGLAAWLLYAIYKTRHKLSVLIFALTQTTICTPGTESTLRTNTPLAISNLTPATCARCATYRVIIQAIRALRTVHTVKPLATA